MVEIDSMLKKLDWPDGGKEGREGKGKEGEGRGGKGRSLTTLDWLNVPIVNVSYIGIYLQRLQESIFL